MIRQRAAMSVWLILCITLAFSSSSHAERRAEVNYILRCAGCHGMNGEGVEAGGVPTFHRSIAVLANDDDGRTYMLHVPGVVSSSLTNAEIAGVLNYILDHWGATSALRFSTGEVERRRAIPVADVVRFRREVVRKLTGQGLSVARYPWP